MFTRSFPRLLPVLLVTVGVGLAIAGDPATTTPAGGSATGTTAPASTLATYTLDANKSSLYVQVFKDPSTVAASMSHDHVILATGWTGTATWDTANLAACKVSISVPTSGLMNDEKSMRVKVGYTTELDEGQRAEVTEHMLDDDQLDAAKYPTITFTSTSCAASGTAVVVKGNMTMHGVTKAVSPSLTITADGTSFTAKGTMKLNGTDYGIQPFSALLGSLKNLNEMKFTIDVKGAVK